MVMSKSGFRVCYKYIVVRMFLIFAFSLYNMSFLHLYNSCSIKDTYLKFSDRTCLWYCKNMAPTFNISYRFDNATMGTESEHFRGKCAFFLPDRFR